MVSPQAEERGAERLGGAMRRAPRATRFFASSPFLLGPSSILIFLNCIFPSDLEYFRPVAQTQRCIL